MRLLLLVVCICLAGVILAQKGGGKTEDRGGGDKDTKDKDSGETERGESGESESGERESSESKSKDKGKAYGSSKGKGIGLQKKRAKVPPICSVTYADGTGPNVNTGNETKCNNANVTSGNETNSNVTSGNETNSNVTNGNETNSNVPDCNESIVSNSSSSEVLEEAPCVAEDTACTLGPLQIEYGEDLINVSFCESFPDSDEADDEDITESLAVHLFKNACYLTVDGEEVEEDLTTCDKSEVCDSDPVTARVDGVEYVGKYCKEANSTLELIQALTPPSKEEEGKDGIPICSIADASSSEVLEEAHCEAKGTACTLGPLQIEYGEVLLSVSFCESSPDDDEDDDEDIIAGLSERLFENACSLSVDGEEIEEGLTTCEEEEECESDSVTVSVDGIEHVGKFCKEEDSDLDLIQALSPRLVEKKGDAKKGKGGKKEKKGGNKEDKKEKKGGKKEEKKEKKGGTKTEKKEKKGGAAKEKKEKKGGAVKEKKEKKGGSAKKKPAKKEKKSGGGGKTKEKKSKPEKSSKKEKKSGGSKKKSGGKKRG